MQRPSQGILFLFAWGPGGQEQRGLGGWHRNSGDRASWVKGEISGFPVVCKRFLKRRLLGRSIRFLLGLWPSALGWLDEGQKHLNPKP